MTPDGDGVLPMMLRRLLLYGDDDDDYGPDGRAGVRRAEMWASHARSAAPEINGFLGEKGENCRAAWMNANPFNRSQLRETIRA